ncbi:MAG: serine/threonine protein kinase [Planctomycetes bacterium]|nr:serine/threonine protein kinase [Planctomycetota bacterium]
MGKSPPSLFLSRWEYQRTLSCHEQGCVLKVLDHRHDVSPTAFKLFKVEDHNALEAARQEFLTLRRLRHPYLAQVGEFGVLPGADVLKEAGLPAEDLKLLGPFLQEQEDQAECSLAYITFEHVEALNLREAFVSLFPDAGGKENGGCGADSWKTYLEALAKICVGLEYVHSRGLIHYDLKPENLLLSPSSSHNQNNGIPGSFEVKLIDFGLCELETTPIGTRARGTVPFVAPEVIEQAHADRRSDLFSLGASIAWSICGRSPFPGDNPAQWLASAREGRTENLRDQVPGIPEKLAELVHRLMATNPEDRPESCRELIEVLEEAGDFTLPGNLNFSSPRIPITGWERELNLVRDELEQLHRNDSTTSLALFETNPGQFTGSFLEEVETMVLTERFEYVEGVCHSPRGNSYSPFREIICKLAESFDLGSPAWEL